VKIEDAYTNLLPINTGVSQGSVIGPLLYLLFTADLPTSPDAMTATYADDTAVLATDYNPAMASQKLQNSLRAIQESFTKWTLKVITTKSTHLHSPIGEKRAQRSTLKMESSPNQKKSNTWDYTRTDDSPGASTSSRKENNLELFSPKCTGL
jgi:hypothetical protein